MNVLSIKLDGRAINGNFTIESSRICGVDYFTLTGNDCIIGAREYLAINNSISNDCDLIIYLYDGYISCKCKLRTFQIELKNPCTPVPSHAGNLKISIICVVLDSSYVVTVLVHKLPSEFL